MELSVPRLMCVWFLVLIWLFTRKEEPVPKDLQKFSIVTQVMIPTLLKPKNTVVCKKAYSNTIRQEWPAMSVSKAGLQQNSLLSELLGKDCLDPCRLSLAGPQSHHRACLEYFYFAVGVAKILDVQYELDLSKEVPSSNTLC